MQYPPVRLADQPADGLTCGIDWARDDHAVVIIDTDARLVYRGVIEHSAKGLKALIAVLARTGVHEVAIERPDGPVVEALLEAGITVVVVNPNQVKNLRSRYGSAGNNYDRFDAFVLADTLRTDRGPYTCAHTRHYRTKRHKNNTPPAANPKVAGSNG